MVDVPKVRKQQINKKYFIEGNKKCRRYHEEVSRQQMMWTDSPLPLSSSSRLPASCFRFQTRPESAEISEIPSLVTPEKKAATVPQKKPRLLAQTQTAKSKG